MVNIVLKMAVFVDDSRGHPGLFCCLIMTGTGTGTGSRPIHWFLVIIEFMNVVVLFDRLNG